MLTTVGKDWAARALGGDVVGYSGTASTAPTATTFTTDGVNIPANTVVGHVVVTKTTYGVILSNTSAANSVLTIDKWYSATSPGGAAATTPAADEWVIVPGNQPAFWIALSTDATSPSAGDTTLASELTGSGLQRKVATYSHTPGASTYVLSAAYTSSDGTQRTIEKIGVFNAANNGVLAYETAIATGTEPVVLSGDTITVTDTVTTSA